MKRYLLVIVGVIFLLTPAICWAHFGMLIAEPPQIDSMEQNNVTLNISFSHPRSGQGMDMEKPAMFGVYQHGKLTDLLPDIQETQIMGHRAWNGHYSVASPGDYIFFLTPSPYWEPAENCFIVHYTKFILNAFDMQDYWDAAIGQPMEIIPLTRPYGLYPANSFTGQVLYKGKPLPGCEVEIEYYDQTKIRPAGSDALITQVVKTNALGYFTCAFPWAGWWGMAALHTDGQITHGQRTADVELGGVLWLYIDELPN